MKRPRVLICDDQEKILAEIRKILYRMYGNTIEIETTRMPEYLLSQWKRHPGETADILLMDIEYPYSDKDGIEIAKELQLCYPGLKVIFMTGQVNHAQDIFDAVPSSFLIKPVDEKRLKDAVDKLLERMNPGEEDIITFKRQGNAVRITANSIHYIESDEHNIIIHTDSCEESFRMKLSDCKRFLPEKRFWRIHQSYIVNSKHIKKMTAKGLELWDGVVLPVARSKYQDIKNRLFDEIENEE